MPERHEEIDWLRGFSAFLVVCGHAIIVFPVNLHEIPWCKYLYDTIYAFHMPLFFFISGYCFSLRGGYGSFLLKKAKRLLIPYCVFAFGGILPRIIFPGMVNGTESVGQSVYNIIFHGGEYWFLYTLFIIFALFPFVKPIIDQYTAIALIAMICVSVFCRSIPNWFCLQQVGYSLPFFSFGYLARKHQLLSWKTRVADWPLSKRMAVAAASVVAIAVCGWAHGAFDHTALNLAEAALGVFACILLALTLPKALGRFGKYSPFSLPLYLLNGYWLVLSRTLSIKVLGATEPVLIILINILIDFFVSYLVIRYLLSKIPIIKQVIGVD